MRGDEDKKELLVTDEELAAKLEKLLGERFSERGKLFVPTTQDYNSLTAQDGIDRLAKTMFRWLGIKPHRLTVVFSENVSTDQHSLYHDNVISIAAVYKGHPYLIAASLALGVLSYFIERYDHKPASKNFLEFASIETGFGLLILNALRPKLSNREKLHHFMDGAWFKHEGLQLSTFTAEQYAAHVATYTHNNRILAEDFLPGVSKQHRYLLPTHITTKSSRFLVEPEVNYLYRKAANSLWVKLILLALIAGSIITATLYIWSQRVETISPEELRDKQAISIIKEAHASCQKNVIEQQNANNPDDFFLQRQVEAEKARCESLRNQYNHAVDQYETLYQ